MIQNIRRSVSGSFLISALVTDDKSEEAESSVARFVTK